jgi:hypothetical protein
VEEEGDSEGSDDNDPHQGLLVSSCVTLSVLFTVYETLTKSV